MLISVTSAFSFEGLTSDFISDASWFSESKKSRNNHLSVSYGYTKLDDFGVKFCEIALDTKYMTCKYDIDYYSGLKTSHLYSGSIQLKMIRTKHFELGIGGIYGWYNYSYVYNPEDVTSNFSGFDSTARLLLNSHLGIQSDFMILSGCNQSRAINIGAFLRF